jgi:hypothetical protein
MIDAIHIFFSIGSENRFFGRAKTKKGGPDVAPSFKLR